MTYLDTLVRILARQRRDQRRQRTFATWQAGGFLLACSILAIQTSVGAPSPWRITALVATGAGLLHGLYGVAVANIILGLIRDTEIELEAARQAKIGLTLYTSEDSAFDEEIDRALRIANRG